jgi:hypothetical protein
VWGCGEVTGLPSADPVPVIQGLLIADQAGQLLQVEWSSPTHLPYESPARPAASSEVDLWLGLPTGDSLRYSPTGIAGQFGVIAEVQNGQRYRLSGTVAAHTIAAEVDVPGIMRVTQPADDTLRLPLESPPVPFAWRADSAVRYQALVEHRDGTARTAFIRKLGDVSGAVYVIAPDTTGELLLLARFFEQADTARLLILGYDRTAAAFFSSNTKGNVRGAFGLFGAAAKSEKVIVWE